MSFCHDELEICGNMDMPGAAIDVDRYVDYSRMEVTEDQQRIMQYLHRHIAPNDSILHVGIGNSDLAAQFFNKTSLIEGLTVSDRELEYARSFDLPNYSVHLLSKHSREFLLLISNKFDYIIDNNLPSFACCRYHFFTMMDNYLWALKPGGKIITDESGLNWACKDPSFVMNYQGLSKLQEFLPIKVSRLTDMVIAVEKQSRPKHNRPVTKSYRLCRKNGRDIIEPRGVEVKQQ